MTVAQKIAGGVAVAMIITAIALPGRSKQEGTVLTGLTNLSKGTIQSAEGR
jgi:hypothetical protein